MERAMAVSLGITTMLDGRSNALAGSTLTCQPSHLETHSTEPTSTTVRLTLDPPRFQDSCANIQVRRAINKPAVQIAYNVQ